VKGNRNATRAHVQWKIIDAATNAVNPSRLNLPGRGPGPDPPRERGDRHFGRLLILSRGGVTEPNLFRKGTVLVKTGETVDILLEVTSPGYLMAHCHIAEHHENGMMFHFQVTG
jgi:FtsP/CotA-like multicopper oxidase with cupredoxin domain